MLYKSKLDKSNDDFLIRLSNEIIKKTNETIILGAPNKKEDLIRTELSPFVALNICNIVTELHINSSDKAIFKFTRPLIQQAIGATQAYFSKRACCKGYSYMGLYFAANSELWHPGLKCTMVGFSNVDTGTSIPVSHHWITLEYKKKLVHCDPWRRKTITDEDFSIRDVVNEANLIQQEFIHYIQSTFKDVGEFKRPDDVAEKVLPKSYEVMSEFLDDSNRKDFQNLCQLFFSLETYFLNSNSFSANNILNLDILKEYFIEHIKQKATSEAACLFIERVKDLFPKSDFTVNN